MSNTQTSSEPMSESQAILQQERIKQIMADTGMNFAQAANQYIKEKRAAYRPINFDDVTGLAASQRPLFESRDEF